MRKRYVVVLSADERAELRAVIAAGAAPARAQTRARILLKADTGADGPGRTDAAIAAAVETSPRTVSRARRQWVEAGCAAIARKRPSGPRRPRLDGAGEARLVMLACSTPPAGRARWTLRLLAERLVDLEVVEHVAHTTVRTVLKKTCSSRG